jgi:hypothetical protein
MAMITSHLVFAGGAFLVLLGIVKALVLLSFHSPDSKIAAAIVRSGVVKQLAPATLMRFETPNIFLCWWGGALSIAFAEQLGDIPLGVLMCAGLACYFALGLWALTTKQDPRPLFSFDTLVLLAPGVCFLAATVSAVAI